MSDSPGERNSNSKSNLIEVNHVGVTAKLQSPLKTLIPSIYSTESDNNEHLSYIRNNTHKTKYDVFTNDTQMESESTITTTAEETDQLSKILYEMRAINGNRLLSRTTPSRIEFQRYCKAKKYTRKTKTPKTKKSKRKLKNRESRKSCRAKQPRTLFQRLRNSFDELCNVKNTTSKILDDLPEPEWNKKSRIVPNRDACIGIYTFEHGTADYLRTTDCHPKIKSIILAERATQYATRFWAEFFGTLYIGVSFMVAFILQSYRFMLYCIVNTLLVGILDMTSDYLFKPFLTVIFNGFLQPPMVFLYNILCSMRDILEPIADTVNNFMKPVATVGKSFRLVHATYNNKKTITKEV